MTTVLIHEASEICPDALVQPSGNFMYLLFNGNCMACVEPCELVTNTKLPEKNIKFSALTSHGGGNFFA